MNESQAERTLQLRVDAREQTHQKQEALLRELGTDTPSPEQNELLTKYRSDLAYFDAEIDTWSEQVDADRKAREKSDEIRRRANAFHVRCSGRCVGMRRGMARTGRAVGRG